MNYWGYGPKPKRVKDGIKLQSEKISRKWWSDRWLSVMEVLGWRGRLYRGLVYARKGQVFDLEVKPGLATAMVQGTRSKPYTVKIAIKAFPEEVWVKVVSAMGARASYIAKLITGELPKGIEEVFISAGVKLFPEEEGDLVMECSCPDKTSPCKHITAVYFVLAEEFDRNPFMIFEFRGRSKKDIMEELGQLRRLKTREDTDCQDIEPVIKVDDRIKVEPLGKCIDRFWDAGDVLKSLKVSISEPKVNLALLKRLGPPVFCDREKYFWSLMEKIYGAAVEGAKATALGDEVEEQEEHK